MQDSPIRSHVALVTALLAAVLLTYPGPAAAQAGPVGNVTVQGELMQWHKVTLDVVGPFARETDTAPNPFTDYRFEVTFTHASGTPSYTVPGYFAADGDAANTSATEGRVWRTHFAPDKAGLWNYSVSFLQGPGVALLTPDELTDHEAAEEVGILNGQLIHGFAGFIEVDDTRATGRDLRAHGRLEYVGRHHLRFAGSGDYFLKAGADAPETLLAYEDFDGTRAHGNIPLKTFTPHLDDWREGDPTWQDGRGKGLIGAISYLASTGCNAFSFLTYNAGGDGDNVWPFVERDGKLHYDCSKLDQWAIVFDHATARGMYLHFKLQETEIDDNRGRGDGDVPESLDGGDLGPERRLYLRELVARFGHNLALNWNLGEENTQSTDQQRAMANFLRDIDPYDHPIVVHTYPNQKDRVYGPLLGDGSPLTGASLQNSSVRDCHSQTREWVARSAEAGRPWVVAFDEPGDASFGTPPDPGYNGWDGGDTDRYPSIHDIRKYALWGTLMAGGGGVEYYFGYRLPENDLLCEDWRSRAQTWAYSAIAINVFHDHNFPFWEMASRDDLVDADPGSNDRYCFAKPGTVYLVYLPKGGTTTLELTDDDNTYTLHWFNPRVGGDLTAGTPAELTGGESATIGPPPTDDTEDWLAVIRRQ